MNKSIKKKTRKKRKVKKVISVAFLAQSVERAALNRAVVGSRPTGGVLFLEKKINKDIVIKKKQRKKKKYKKRKEKFTKKTLPLGIEPRTYRLTADRSAD